MEEVEKHASEDDLWIVVHHKVYDVTGFLLDHPGGKNPFLHFAGKDASEAFDKVHPSLDISKITAVIYKGNVSV